MSDTTAIDGRSRRLLPTTVAYGLLVGVPAILIAVLLRIGEQLPAATTSAAGAAATPRPAGGAPAFDLGLLTLQIVVIVAAAQLTGGLLARLGQPRVVGEMAAGLILGPSVFGRLAPSLWAAVFPGPSLGFVNAIAQVGLLLFMFLVGLELDPTHLRRRGKAALLTSHASIVAPFLLGTALALGLYPRLAPAGVGFTPFALFVGAAMSVTAFPVLARILADRGMTTTPLGALAIVCAAVGDVTAWCILAAVVVIARASGVASLAFTLAGTAIYLAFMFTFARPLLARVAERAARPGSSAQTQLALVMLLALSSAWVTERLGIHALFGAFLVGALLPPSGPLAEALSSRLRDLMIVLLLPLFFAFTGLRTTVSLISGGWLWLVCGLVLLVAIAGKLGGSAVAARAAGMGWRDALSLGTLMNTRGLMELVILNVGLDIGVLSPTLFAMMVVMALVTTALTTPLLDLLQHGRGREATQVI
jgi:Kef-type K+ transport system membrane component KefB